MQNVRWFVRAIAGLDPDAAPNSARLAIVVARYDSGEGDAQAGTHEFEMWIPAELTDLATIERAVYRELRDHLIRLLASLPGPWPRSAPMNPMELPGVPSKPLNCRSYWIGLALGVGLTVAVLVVTLWRGLR
jgi:hypothetical protein